MTRRLSIVVVSYNTCAKTYRCLCHLLCYTDIPFHIWVIDNGSVDKSVNMLKKIYEAHSECLTVLRSDQNLGYSGALQLVYPYIPSSDDIAYVNSDVYVWKQWASNLQKHILRHPQVAAVGPLGRGIGGRQDYVIRYGPLPNRCSVNDVLQSVNEQLLQENFVSETTKMLLGTLLVVNRDAHQALGGLDPGCSYGGDDVDFCLRARLSHWELLIALDTFVWHDNHSSFQKLGNQAQNRIEQSWSYLNQKWVGQLDGISWDDLMVNQTSSIKPYFVYKQYRHENVSYDGS